MGSGSSKETGSSRPGGAKPVTVANVNNNTNEKVGTVESKSVIRNGSESIRNSPSKSPAKESNRWDSKNDRSPKKSAKKDDKFTGKMNWDDSDIDDDDWEDFLGKPSRNPVPKTESKVLHAQNEGGLNPNNRAEQEDQERYPETYAQRLNREQYTFGQDRLIREKTIYRNPEEWGIDDDDDDDEEQKTTKGFDASRFRAANQGKSARDKDIFTPREDDIELPIPTKANDSNEMEQSQMKSRPASKKVPVYTKEEEDLMADLLQDDFNDFLIGHQAVNSLDMMS